MNDLISRQAAIEAVSKACFELRGVFGRCEDALKALPSAEPERKKGQWVEVDVYCKHLEETTGERYQPSGVGDTIYCDRCWLGTNRRSNFCPNCGADMRNESVEGKPCRGGLVMDKSATKERFIEDVSRILSESTFRSNDYVEDFAHDVWYVKDYLTGYFLGDWVKETEKEIRRPKGKWIRDRYCSSCEWDKSDFHYIGGWKGNFCPNCGADMRGGE